MINYSYAFALLLAAILSISVAVFAWNRRTSPGATGLTLAMLGTTIWSFTYAIRWLVINPKAQLIWLDATYLGVVIAPTAFFIFALQFSSHDHLLTRRNLLFLAIEPAITLILIWTDTYHNLFYGGLRTAGSILSGGIWFWINVSYIYILLILAAVFILQTYLHTNALFRRQAALIFLGMLIPWFGSILGLMKISPFPDLDLTPFAFIISGVMLMRGIFRFHLLDINPIAQTKLVENMRDGVVVVDNKLQVVDLNPAARKMIAVDIKAIGQPAEVVFQKYPEFLTVIGQKKEIHLEIHTNHNSSKEYEIRTTLLYDIRNRVSGQLVVLRDITKEKQALLKLQQSEEQYRQLFENANECIVVIQDGKIKFCNPITSQLTGFPIEEIVNSPFKKFIHAEDIQTASDNHARRLIGDNDGRRYEMRLLKKDQSIQWVEVSGIRILWEGKPATLNFLIDISERRQVEMTLRYQSTHDILTGLYNRQYYEIELDKLQKSRRFPVSILVMDMNGLKEVNDTFGHGAGDERLQMAAKVIQQVFRSGDMVARIGGDEFVVVLPETDEAEAQLAVQRVQQALQEHNQSAQANKLLSIAVGAATGIKKCNLRDIFRQADKAMYQDKASACTNSMAYEV